MWYPTKKLKDICEILLWWTPSRNNKSYWWWDNSWCSIADMKTKIISNTKDTITDEWVKNSNVKLLKKGTLFMSFKLSIWKLAFAWKDLYTNEAIAWLPIKNNNELDNNFLYYILNWYNFNISWSDNSVKWATLNKAKLEKLSIPLPPLSTQKLIVQKLDSSFEKIDKSIELTKKNLENIEELNKSVLEKVFKEWEYDEIIISDICNIERWGSPRPIKAFLTEDDNWVNWIKIWDTKNSFKYIEGTNEKIKPEWIKKSRMVYPWDFILSNSMSFWRPYIMKTTWCIHDWWLVLRTDKEMINDDFLYYLLGSHFMYEKFEKTSSWTTVKNLNIWKVKDIKIPLPPLSKQKEIVLYLDQIFEKNRVLKEKYENKLKDLEEMKQSLLKEAFEWRLVKE